MRWTDLAPTRLLDRYAERDMRLERSIVTHGFERVKRLMWQTGARFTIGIAALLISQWAPDPSVLDAGSTAVIGLIIGAWCGAILRRAGAYRNGWLDGRQRLVQALREHDNVEDWLDTEANRDVVHVLGLPPIPPPPGHSPGEGRDG